MTKIKNYIICIPIIIWLIWSFCFWLLNREKRDNGVLEKDFPYAKAQEITKCDGDNTDLWNCVSTKESNDTIIVRLLEVFGLDYSTDKSKDLKFIDYAKALLNLALSLIAFITLIMSIYTFYLMIFSDNDKSIEKAKKNLIWIFIALCVIWLSRLIVSVIFRRYQKHRLEQQENLPTINAEIIEQNRN
jgi:hypothetical protein